MNKEKVFSIDLKNEQVKEEMEIRNGSNINIRIDLNEIYHGASDKFDKISIWFSRKQMKEIIKKGEENE